MQIEALDGRCIDTRDIHQQILKAGCQPASLEVVMLVISAKAMLDFVECDADESREKIAILQMDVDRLNKRIEQYEQTIHSVITALKKEVYNEY